MGGDILRRHSIDSLLTGSTREAAAAAATVVVRVRGAAHDPLVSCSIHSSLIVSTMAAAVAVAGV